MTTVIIQIGNTDNKLTQQEWSRFISVMQLHIDMLTWEVHFCGGSHADAPHQNYCWVMEAHSKDDLHKRLQQKDDLREIMQCIAKEFKQDSIAVTVGKTIFIKP